MTSRLAPLLIAVAEGQPAVDHVGQARGLRDHVDRSARRAASASDRRRSLGDFDGFDVEGVAADFARVTGAVDVDVVADIESADEDVVAETDGSAGPLADAHGDARRVAQHVAQGGRVLLLEHLLRNDGDLLRRVADLVAVLRRLGGRGMVPDTSTKALTGRTFSDTMLCSNVALTDRPASRRVIACSGVKLPDTPGEDSVRSPGLASTVRSCVVRSYRGQDGFEGARCDIETGHRGTCGRAGDRGFLVGGGTRGERRRAHRWRDERGSENEQVCAALASTRRFTARGGAVLHRKRTPCG